MARIQVLLNNAALQGVHANAALSGAAHPMDYTGPVFEDAEIGVSKIAGMVVVQPNGEKVAYMYNLRDISRIKYELIDAPTESGILIARGDLNVAAL